VIFGLAVIIEILNQVIKYIESYEKKTIDYDRINEILGKKNTEPPKQQPKPRITNPPINRNEIALIIRISLFISILKIKPRKGIPRPSVN
jgi:hypothetical protein